MAGRPPPDPETFAFDPDVFFVTDPDLDFAVVAVRPSPLGGGAILDRGFLRLIPETGKIKPGEFATILQHPDGALMQRALRENEIKRVEPDEPYIGYVADTAHGSSGAPVFNDSFQLVALHANGHIRCGGALRAGPGAASRTASTVSARRT